MGKTFCKRKMSKGLLPKGHLLSYMTKSQARNRPPASVSPSGRGSLCCTVMLTKGVTLESIDLRIVRLPPSHTVIPKSITDCLRILCCLSVVQTTD